MIFEWKDPPQETKSTRTRKYTEIRLALKVNPNRWAFVSTEPSVKEVAPWRQAFRRRDGFMVHQHSLDSSKVEVYIKYVNENSTPEIEALNSKEE